MVQRGGSGFLERDCRLPETVRADLPDLGGRARLPVHRLNGSPKARVFAYADEIDRWLKETVSSTDGGLPIAVLPLRNLSNDGDQDQLADALTEGLIMELGSLSAFRVISRRSVWRFKDSMKPLSAIGRELDVKAVVDGSVIRSRDRVRISAGLYPDIARAASLVPGLRKGYAPKEGTRSGSITRRWPVGRGFRTNAAAVDSLPETPRPAGCSRSNFHLPYGSGPADVRSPSRSSAL